jgi:2-oxoglutarate ferredoxin oxidoreductase subunit delta
VSTEETVVSTPMAEPGATAARSEIDEVRSPRRKAAAVRVDRELCKVCGICIALCPTGVFDADAHGAPVVARLEACTACRFCELHCPDFAIEVEAALAGPPADDD